VNAKRISKSKRFEPCSARQWHFLYISGGPAYRNSFRIDGISVNDYANGGPGSSLRVNMGVDAIREFRSDHITAIRRIGNAITIATTSTDVISRKCLTQI